jgi:hypothetical protein
MHTAGFKHYNPSAGQGLLVQLLGSFDSRLGSFSSLVSFSLSSFNSLVSFSLGSVHSVFNLCLSSVSSLLNLFHSRSFSSRSHFSSRSWSFYSRSCGSNRSFFLFAASDQSSRSNHGSQDQSFFHINTSKGEKWVEAAHQLMQRFLPPATPPHCIQWALIAGFLCLTVQLQIWFTGFRD